MRCVARSQPPRLCGVRISHIQGVSKCPFLFILPNPDGDLPNLDNGKVERGGCRTGLSTFSPGSTDVKEYLTFVRTEIREAQDGHEDAYTRVASCRECMSDSCGRPLAPGQSGGGENGLGLVV